MLKSNARDRPFQRYADARYAWKRFALTLVVCGVLGYMWYAWDVDGYSADPAASADKPVIKNPAPYSYPEKGQCDDPDNTPVITWEEFDRHSCESEDLWVIIAGKVYDVYKFMPFHPGGPALCVGAHTDITKAFWGLHPGYVHTNMLPRFCIGQIDRIPPDVAAEANK